MKKNIPILRNLLELIDFSGELDLKSAVSNIRRNVPFRGTNIFILACAIIIASLGLNLNSTAVIIVSLHWGGEHTLQPVPRQRYEAHQLIHAGADILVCHHTHTLQTIENFQGRPIYYSIGNFIFDQHKPHNARACIVRLRIKKESIQTETIPIIIRNCVPFISSY